MSSFFDDWAWQPHWNRITTIDLHAGGEPLRVITSGLPTIEGQHGTREAPLREHYDHLRTGLMWEPRGHADMYGAVVTPSENADFDVFFLHNEGYSTMCGHAILALTKLVIEANMAKGPGVSFNVPAGRIEMDHWIAGGVSLAKLFRALTIDNARMFHLDDKIGSVEPGKIANLLLLRADPLQSVKAYDTIETVFLHGRPTPRGELSARKAVTGVAVRRSTGHANNY